MTDFVWTAFRSRYATEGAVVSDSWEDYVDTHAEWATLTIEKRKAPGIIHGDCGGSRLQANVKTATALVIDSDASLLPEGDIDAILTPFAALRYLFSWRRGKFHLVLPLAEPIDTPTEIRPRRECALGYFARLLKRPLDMTAARSYSLLHPYTRPEDFSDDEAVILRVGDGDPLDLDTLLARENYRQRSPREAPTTPRTPRQAPEWSSAVERALGARGLTYPDAKVSANPDGTHRRAIRCPFHPDDSKGPHDTSTVMFVESGWIHCSHNRCAWRDQAEFLREIGTEPGDFPPYIQALLEEAPGAEARVSLDEAGRRIRLALMGAKPHERSATVVRVTTGAGKTRAAAEFLDGYCSPRWDSETGDVIAGKTAFLATPTNALLREVSSRIGVEHRVAVGTLAVLNPDGTQACKKWATAKALQAAGGDVHRLMCASCEFHDGGMCPALTGRVTGDGALTLTNHALLPSLVASAVEAGKVPLIVWDESPQFVDIRRLAWSDLEWMLDRFDTEEDPRRGVTLARLQEPTVFSDRYRVAMRPLLEVLRRVRGTGGLADAVTEWAGTRLAESQLCRAEAALNLPTGGGVSGTWDRVVRCAGAARRANVADMAFDAMGPAAREAVLRAEGLHGAVLATTVEGARFWLEPGALEIASVTANGRLWRDFGGVVLDATAPVHDLRALRPDATVVDISVEDAGESVRTFYFTPGIGRRALAGMDDGRRVLTFDKIAKEVKRSSVRFERNVGRAPRVLVLGYKTYLDEIKTILETEGVGGVEGVETHHYGDTRGYDGWFQRGFDVFVTIGDPYANVVSEDRAYDTLGVERNDPPISIDDYCAYRARSESAQAHGRGRDPVEKKADGARIHLHFGRLPPLGWALDNTKIGGSI